MKSAFFFLFILCCQGLAKAQNFEGILTYSSQMEVSEKMKKMGMTTEQLMEQMKKEGTYADTIKTSYKDGNYFTELKALKMYWSIYRADSNKIFTFNFGSDICTVMDASKEMETVVTGAPPKIIPLDSTVNILGHVCKIVRIKYHAGQYDYCYDPSFLKMSPDLFSKDSYDGFGSFMKISGALPMRIVKSVGGMMSTTFTLTEAHEGKISNDLFHIPTLGKDPDLNMMPYMGKLYMKVITL